MTPGQPTTRPEIQMTQRSELRDWLADNHGTSSGIWLVSWRTTAAGPRIPYDAVVEECLCVGWIDSTLRVLDDLRSAQQLTPRKPGSGWAATNKIRVAALSAAGLMLPAGLAAVQQAKSDGSWEFLDEIERLEIPPDLAAALAACGAQGRFTGLSASRRKMLLLWIKQAKRDTTRADRIAKTAAAAAEGRSALQG